jgi:hypothetical protein
VLDVGFDMMSGGLEEATLDRDDRILTAGLPVFGVSLKDPHLKFDLSRGRSAGLRDN